MKSLAYGHLRFRPFVIHALRNTFTAAQLSDAILTAQALQHDPDFLFCAILLAGRPADVLDHPLRGRL